MAARAGAPMMRLVAGVAALLSLAPEQATDRQRFRSGAELVAVDVLVMDGRRIVTGLTAADFVLLDEGVPQTIEQLHVAHLPLNVIMVLDVSWSLEGPRLLALKAAASALVDRLRPEDRAALLAFSHRLELRSGLTADRRQLHERIARLAADGSTGLRDAVYAGLALRGTDTGRTLMLLFTDGVDTASFLDEERVLQAVRRSDVTVYSVGLRDAPPATPLGRLAFPRPTAAATTDDRFLKALATESGGRVVYADGENDLGRTFGRVLEEFSSRYILGYTPAGVAATGWHRVEVTLKRPRTGAVTARRGYFAR